MTFSSGVELDDILKHPFNVCHMYRQTVLLCQIIKSDFSPKFWMDLLMLSLSWSLRKSSQITHQLPRHLLSLYYRENYLEKYLLLFLFSCLYGRYVCVSAPVCQVLHLNLYHKKSKTGNSVFKKEYDYLYQWYRNRERNRDALLNVIITLRLFK